VSHSSTPSPPHPLPLLPLFSLFHTHTGHASENPRLPDSLAKTDRKVVFIGPPGAPMRALGDKIGSTIIAQSAGVPVIAWNGNGIMCDYASGGYVPPPPPSLPPSL